MTKALTEQYKRQMQDNAEEARLADLESQKHMPQHPSARSLTIDDAKKDSKYIYQLYIDWLKTYQEKKPNFKPDENQCDKDEHGNVCIKFKDPQAEEDFVRQLAANDRLSGFIIDKGIKIAKFENGKLIDPRTNEEFKAGEYAKLVQQLDSGVAYKDIPSSEPSEQNRFGI